MHKHALGEKSFDLRVSHLPDGWHCPQIGYSATLEALPAKLSTTCSSTSPRINKRVDSFVRLGLRPVMREKLPPKTGVERSKHISSKLEYHFAKWVSPSSIGSILEIGASSLLAMALYRSSSETVQKHSKANRSRAVTRFLHNSSWQAEDTCTNFFPPCNTYINKNNFVVILGHETRHILNASGTENTFDEKTCALQYCFPPKLHARRLDLEKTLNGGKCSLQTSNIGFCSSPSFSQAHVYSLSRHLSTKKFTGF